MTKKFSKLKWWQIALLSIVVSAIGGLSGGLPSKERKLYLSTLKSAPWTPPGWFIGPAWMVANFFLLKALQRILKKSPSAEKRKALILQGLIWSIFLPFNYIYFNKKSPILVALLTMSDAALAVESFMIIIKSDKKTAYHYIPLITWTLFASTLGNYHALKNPDPVFGTKALLDEPKK